MLERHELKCLKSGKLQCHIKKQIDLIKMSSFEEVFADYCVSPQTQFSHYLSERNHFARTISIDLPSPEKELKFSWPSPPTTPVQLMRQTSESSVYTTMSAIETMSASDAFSMSYQDDFEMFHSDDIDGFTCKVKGCFAMFSTVDLMRNHNLNMHPEKPFFCLSYNCASVFARKHDLHRHIKNIHEKRK